LLEEQRPAAARLVAAQLRAVVEGLPERAVVEAAVAAPAPALVDDPRAR
jgi:hypothetical protein